MANQFERKRKREDRSGAPSPAGYDYVKIKFKVQSWLKGLKVSEEPVKRLLHKDTSAEELAKHIEEAINLRVKSAPSDWTKPQFKRTVALGNELRKLSFATTQHYQLGDYSKDSNGVITCVIDICGKLAAHEKRIRVHKESYESRSRHAPSDKATQTSQQPAARGESPKVVVSVETQPNASMTNNTSAQSDEENIIVVDVNQVNATDQRPRKPSNQRAVQVRVAYRGLPWTRLTNTRILRNAGYEELTAHLTPDVYKPVTPDYLEPLVNWCCRIGTERVGFEPAIPGKLLSEYPGANEQAVIIEIKTGLMRPIRKNLGRPNPYMLTQIPGPQLVCKWLRELACEEKLKSQADVDDEQALTDAKTDRLASLEAQEIADVYGYLVHAVRRRKLQADRY